MLSMVDPSKSMDKKIFKDEMDILESTLSMMQQAVAAAKIPVVVVFEGWSASGKGTNISKLVQPLDPRSFNVYTMGKTNDDILMRPFLWPYFTRLPAKGRIAIFDKSWHRIATPDGMEKLRIRDKDVSTIYRDINAFDRLLTDDGTLLVKLFLHIGREEQRKRFKELEKSPDTAWRVEGKDWQQNERYDQYLSMFEKMLDMTDTHDNPWHIIESEDRKYSTVKIYRTIISIINARLNERAEEKKDSASAPGVVYATEKLRGAPAGREADEEYYKRETGSLQKELDM
ncbi:MAG: phosphate--AMP phosphotransferase, partial [Defluviitaleaceae bacterium]|nr:phosphate--AMP phosphotransferase [Defluviitaleaceae bacterium]